MGNFWLEFSNPVRFTENEANGKPKPVAKVHTNSAPQIANSVTAMKIEARIRERLGECPNVKGDRPKGEDE